MLPARVFDIAALTGRCQELRAGHRPGDGAALALGLAPGTERDSRDIARLNWNSWNLLKSLVFVDFFYQDFYKDFLRS